MVAWTRAAGQGVTSVSKGALADGEFEAAVVTLHEHVRGRGRTTETKVAQSCLQRSRANWLILLGKWRL